MSLSAPLLDSGGHGHGHGHGHDGEGHGHGHGLKSLMSRFVAHCPWPCHGHGHGSEHGRAHEDEGHEHGSGHGHAHEDEGHGHPAHGHGHEDACCQGHGEHGGHGGHDEHGHGHGGHGHDEESHGHGGHDLGHGHGHGHDHDHGHGHASGREESEIKRLRLACILAFFFVLVEVVGGVIAGSVAVLTDAAHLTSDFGGFLMTITTLRLTQRQATGVFSYGFKQAEVIGALVNILVLWILTVVLCACALYRVVFPQVIDGRIMCFIGGFGVVVNLLLWAVMAGSAHGHSHGPGEEHDHDDESLGMKAAIAHRIGDLVQSLGVFLGALLIFLKPFDIGTVSETDISRWNYADPICTFLFACLVYKTSEKPFFECLRVLMSAAPQRPTPAEARKVLEAVPGVASVDDLHIWSVGTGNACVTAHICMSDNADSVGEMLDATTKAARSLGLYHTTFQLEPAGYSGMCHSPERMFHGAISTDELYKNPF